MKRTILNTAILLLAVALIPLKFSRAQTNKKGTLYSTLSNEPSLSTVRSYGELQGNNLQYKKKNTRVEHQKSILNQTTRISRLINYHSGATTALSLLGGKYGQRGVYDSSLLYYKQALYHSLHVIPNNGTTANIYVTIGKIYAQTAKEDSACLYMYKGLKTLETSKYDLTEKRTIKNAYKVYRHIGAFWMGHNDMENALIYLNKATLFAKMSNDHTVYHDALLVKGTIFFRQGKLDSAISYYSTLLKNPSVPLHARVLADQNMARILLKMPEKENLRRALPYLLEAFQLSKKNDYKFYMIHNQSLLAVLYGSIGDFKNAEQLLTEILNDPGKTSLGTNNLILQHKNLARVYENLGKYKQGFDQMQEVVSLQDTLIQQERTNSINEFEYKYRTAEKDKLLAQRELQVSKQQKELERQYTLLIGGGSSALLIIIALGLLLRVKKQKQEIQRLKATMIGEERERARMARELHDGTVSTLSAIRMNLSALPLLHPEMNGASQDLQKSLLRLDQTIAELRNTSHNLLPEFLFKAGLTEAVRVYTSDISSLGQVEIEFMMIGKMPTLKQDFQLTVYRIIQELINNIIKHANATHALVQFQVMNEQLNITVDDNGNGIPFEQSKTTSGIGLQNLRNRVKSLNGTLEIESNKGTSVYLTFNLQPFTINTVAGKMQGLEQ